MWINEQMVLKGRQLERFFFILFYVCVCLCVYTFYIHSFVLVHLPAELISLPTRVEQKKERGRESQSWVTTTRFLKPPSILFFRVYPLCVEAFFFVMLFRPFVPSRSVLPLAATSKMIPPNNNSRVKKKWNKNKQERKDSSSSFVSAKTERDLCGSRSYRPGSIFLSSVVRL